MKRHNIGPLKLHQQSNSKPEGNGQDSVTTNKDYLAEILRDQINDKNSFKSRKTVSNLSVNDKSRTVAI